MSPVERIAIAKGILPSSLNHPDTLVVAASFASRFTALSPFASSESAQDSADDLAIAARMRPLAAHRIRLVKEQSRRIETQLLVAGTSPLSTARAKP